MADLKELIKDVQVILNRVADKSEGLIGNFTTNLAESWMAVRCKFDGGKVINRCGKGSWNTRCYGGALRKTLELPGLHLHFKQQIRPRLVSFSIKPPKDKLRNSFPLKSIWPNLKVNENYKRENLKI